MSSYVYGSGALGLLVGGVTPNPIDWLNNVIQLGLSTSTHVPNKDDTFLDDAGTDDFVDGELSGPGYARQTLVNKTLTYDAANDRVELDADDVTFVGLNAGTAAQATIFQSTGGVNTARRLIGNIDSGGFPFVSTGRDLVVQFNVAGIVNQTV